MADDERADSPGFTCTVHVVYDTNENCLGMSGVGNEAWSRKKMAGPDLGY
jgi:hypothetical protein